MIFHIIFLFLKFIVMLLLAVIALLLILILTVLIVPIRYSVNVEHGDGINADCRVTWLLHLLNASISYSEEKFHIRVRLLLFTLYDNLKTGKPKIKKRKKQKKENSKAGSHDNGTAILDTDLSDYRKPYQRENVKESADNSIKPQNVAEKTEDGFEKKSSFSVIVKVKKFFGKIKAFFQSVRNKIIRIYNNIGDIWSKLKLISEFLQSGENREGFMLTYSKLKKILKHILPGKLKSRVRFGTGDPCSTGQALGAFSIFYSFYGDNISITPDFENRVFEGEHYARGRISLLTVLVIVFKLIRDERFKKLKRNFQLLKEAL